MADSNKTFSKQMTPKLRRVWFKKEMKDAIVAGRKFTTTRDHQIPNGRVAAVCGSRYKAEKFAELVIVASAQTTWAEVMAMHFRDEGFDSPFDLLNFGYRNGLISRKRDGANKTVFIHRFIIGEISAPNPKEADP